MFTSPGETTGFTVSTPNDREAASPSATTLPAWSFALA